MEWRKVIYENIETNYSVSSTGRVRNDSTNRELNPSTQQDYKHITLQINGKSKRFRVHRLVAIAFIPNPDNLPEVNHKDECKTNNCVDNLEWCDHKYNNNYGSKKGSTSGTKNHQNKFTEEMVRDIKQNYIPYDEKFGAKAF